VQNKPIKVQNNNDLFFSETTALIEKFILKTQLYEKITDKKLQTELVYSYLIQFVLLKVLVDSNFTIFVIDYQQKLQNIVSNLKKGAYLRVLAIIRNLANKIEQDLYKPFKEDQKFINENLDLLLAKDEEQIQDISIWLDLICYINRFDFSGITNDIFGSIYENYLKELYSQENLGQFFTPPEVVDFMLQQIGWTESEIKVRALQKDSLSIIDPSCGSGTFLYSAANILMQSIPHNTQQQAKYVENLINNNIFGLDVEEFSLYLAEMSLLMRLLPCIINEKYNNPVEKKLKIFKTKCSVAEFWTQYQLNKSIDQDNALHLFGNNYLDLGYKSLLRNEDDIKQTKEALIENNLARFDFVIGNPPYIGYNECSKNKLLCFEMIKGNVVYNNRPVKIDLSDVYGINLHSLPHKSKKYSPKPNLYAFFIALANGLLKNNGKMCYIIPQTILSTSDYDVIRYYLAKNFIIDKIIIFACKMFVCRGVAKKRDIATSSLILVATKTIPSNHQQVEIVHYANSEASVEKALSDIAIGKNTTSKKILQSELLNNADNWNYIKQDACFLEFYNFYKHHSEDFSCYYEHKQARARFGSEFWFDIGYGIDEKLAKNNDRGDYILPKISKNRYLIKQAAGYWHNKRDQNDKQSIILLKANQKFNLLDSKYKIIWKYAGLNLFYFSDDAIIWARNNMCGIGSNNYAEMLFLYAILSSATNDIILQKLTVLNNESISQIRPINYIKSFVRIPLINQQNQWIKQQIINKTEAMLALEKQKLSDVVNFSTKLAVLPQQFTQLTVNNGKLIADDIIFAIADGNEDFVADLVKNVAMPISLQKLQQLEAIDFVKRQYYKDNIDHLVFALYFQINLDNNDNIATIKQKCQESKHYKVKDL
jgi:type I restriction-modification system DNA methylase subunit